MSPVLELDGVTRAFYKGERKIPVLDGLSLHQNAGELVLISGVSGSGKTTLLNIVSGLDDPDQGKVQVMSHTLSELSMRDREELRLKSIGIVFQEANLVPDFTARENVELVLRASGLRDKDPRETGSSQTRV